MRDWWLRTLLVLQRPRPVFVALRDDSPESRSDRAEPILALVILAGIAGALASRSSGHVLDDNSGIVVVPWVLFGGLISGTVAYFAVGALLHWGARLLGSQ